MIESTSRGLINFTNVVAYTGKLDGKFVWLSIIDNFKFKKVNQRPKIRKINLFGLRLFFRGTKLRSGKLN